jgi:AcrR family transcriptional regulator
MNATKKKILAQSLVLFNNYGISNISLRKIADEIGISVGNLQYHFKKREDIVEALYFELVEKMDAIFTIPKDEILTAFLGISRAIITTLYEYNFFLLDFVTITRNNEKIKTHYAQLSKQRELTTLKMITVLIENKVFRKEILKDEYKYLYKRIEVISNFWFSSILIQNEHLSEKIVEEYLVLIHQSIFPYLTDDAKEKYVGFF